MGVDSLKFSAVFLQDDVVKFLQTSLAKERISQAYLFLGSPSIGKMKVALTFAGTLQCLAPQFNSKDSFYEACGKCLSCKRILVGSHPDVSIISPIGKDIRIDQIRQIREDAFLNPFMGKWRIFIIDGAERLNESSSNCLLKILEESPSKVIFILLANNDLSLLPTIVSRTTKLVFRKPLFQEARNVLSVVYNCPKNIVAQLFSLAEGKFGTTINWLNGGIDFNDFPELDFNRAQTGLIELLVAYGNLIQNALEECTVLEQLHNKFDQKTSPLWCRMSYFKKSFLLRLFSTRRIPVAFPILFTQLYLATLDQIKSTLKKSITKIVADQKSNYSSVVLKELEEVLIGCLTEEINSLMINFFETAINILSDVFYWQHTENEETLLNIQDKEDIISLSKRLGVNMTRHYIRQTNSCIENIRRYVNPALVFENFLSEFGGITF